MSLKLEKNSTGYPDSVNNTNSIGSALCNLRLNRLRLSILGMYCGYDKCFLAFSKF
ncbi:MAG: hypothetical protein ACKPCM_12095 [Pseudanabaena sp.]